MERNLVGYAGNPPQIAWPNQARIALNFVINYEEGSERCVLDGDEESESYLTDFEPVKGRNLSTESMFEYGSRVGIWRLLQLFDSKKIPLTFFATGLAVKRNPHFAQYLQESSHEVAGHGLRWINYRDVEEDKERRDIRETLDILEALTKKQVKGWYTGRKSMNTRKLIIEQGLLYDSDSYADDLPYWVNSHLVIPYSLDINDCQYAKPSGFSSGEDFYTYLKAAFDCLYREGGKMLTIGLHPRISGKPAPCEFLRKFVEYVQPFDVWICKREEIAAEWNTQLGK